MLGKLIKHEFKDSWLILTVLNVAVIVLSIIGSLSSREYMDFVDDLDFSGFIYGIYFMVYAFGLIALLLAATFYFYVRFFKNMDQGYLMHTLPVTANEHIISKLIVALAWRIVSFLVIVSGMFLISFRYENVFEMLKKMELTPLDLVLIILIVIRLNLYSILIGYASISIGQFSNKNKVFSSILAYFGIKTVIKIGSSFLALIDVLSLRDMIDKLGSFDVPGYRYKMMLIYIIATYSMSVVFYIITHWIMKNRLNLE